MENLLLDLRRQQSEIREGNMNAGGPPPPPPPPPLPGVIPASRLPSEIPRHIPQKAPPMALAGAMMKEKKPFTYTPGGIDLSEIKSPRMARRLSRNAASEGVRPSPLAQQPPTPPTPATANSQQYNQAPFMCLPMPGMGMGKPEPQKPKEPPKPQRSVCGPAPLAAPFVAGNFTPPIQKYSPPEFPTMQPQSPVSQPIVPQQTFIQPQNMIIQQTINNPNIITGATSPPANNGIPMMTSASAYEPSNDNVPAPPPMPPPMPMNRRGSLVAQSPGSMPLLNGGLVEPSPPPIPPPQAVRLPMSPPGALIIQPKPMHQQTMLGVPPTPSPPPPQDTMMVHVDDSFEEEDFPPPPAEEEFTEPPETDYTPSSNTTPSAFIMSSPQSSISMASPIKTAPTSLHILENDIISPVTSTPPRTFSPPLSPLLSPPLSPPPISMAAPPPPPPPMPVGQARRGSLVQTMPLSPDTQNNSFSMISLIKEPSPMSYVNEPIKEPSPLKQFVTSMKEPSPIRQAVTQMKEPSPLRHAQSPIKEPSPVRAPVKEPSPMTYVQRSPIKDASPIRYTTAPVTDSSPVRLQQAPLKAASPMRQAPAPVKDPSPVQQASVPVSTQVPTTLSAKEPSPLRQVHQPLKEVSPMRQTSLRDPSPIRSVTFNPIQKASTPVRQVPQPQQQFALADAIKQPSFNSLPDPSTILTSPRATPVKQPTPVRQISREASPMKPMKEATPIIQQPQPKQPPVSNSPLQTMPQPKQTSVPSSPQQTTPQPKQTSVPSSPQLTPQTRQQAQQNSPNTSQSTANATRPNMIRQSSLPHHPSLPTSQVGSLYIPPVENSAISQQSQSMPPADSRSQCTSPTNGLSRAPLSWMSAVPRQSSEQPPEFATAVLQKQNRLQRQRSLGPESHQAPAQKISMPMGIQPQMAQQPGPCIQQMYQQKPAQQQTTNQVRQPQPQIQTQQPKSMQQQQVRQQQPVHQPNQGLQPQPVQQPQQVRQPQSVQPQQVRQPQPMQQPQPVRQPQPMQQPQPVRQPQPLQQPQPVRQPQPMQQPQPVRRPQPMQQPQPVQQPQPIRQPQPQQPQPRQPQPMQQPQLVQQPQPVRPQPQQPPQQQSYPQQGSKSRERIIPIMVERDSPPRQLTSQPARQQQPTQQPRPVQQQPPQISQQIPQQIPQQMPQQIPQQIPQQFPQHMQQPQWASSPGSAFSAPQFPTLQPFGGLGSPLGTNTLGSPIAPPLAANSAFMPYNSPVGLHSSNNALDALQQMQSQLAQLNSGLQNTQYRPQQNGSVAPNAPTTNGSDDEIWNYMQHSEPQVHQSDQEVQQTQQFPNAQQTNFQQNYPEQYDGVIQEQSIPQQLKQNQNDTSPQQRFQQLQGQAVGNNSPKESKFMRLLQTVTDTLPDGAEPQGPVHLPNLRKKVGQPQQQQQQQQQQQLHQQPNAAPIGSQLGGVAPVPSQQQMAPEPKKYMGGAIPSRSFKMLQQMTASNDVTNVGDSTTTLSEPQEGEDNEHAAIHNPPSSASPSSSTSSPDPPTNHKPLSRASSTDSGISSSSSKITPQYMSARDGKVYRNVTPKLVVNGSKEGKIVNSALRSGSVTSRTVSPMPWKNGNNYPSSPRSHSPGPGSPSPLEQSNAQFDFENNSKVQVFRQDSNVSNASTDSEKRYEGGHIPSRVFRYLQNEYADKNENSESEYQNGIQGTAVQKETVLKELCSQFDQTEIVKKPKAAPGKIFRHLQDQYDNDDPASKGDVQPAGEVSRSFGVNSKNKSPSFRFLQSQYQNEEPKEQQKKEEPVASDAPEYENAPGPYDGGRTPGQTFSMLNSNITAHPSVFGNRK